VRFWFLWFWIWLLPASNLIPGLVYYADRYLYLPSIGAFVLLGMAGSRLARSDLAAQWSPERRRRVLASTGAMLAAAYAGVAFLRMEVWRDELSFWKDAVEKSPGMYKAHLNLGVAYETKGRLTEAEREYVAAERIFSSPKVRENLQMLRARAAARASRPDFPAGERKTDETTSGRHQALERSK
jgi:tetratricopeptide (TPR) repeat protein